MGEGLSPFATSETSEISLISIQCEAEAELGLQSPLYRGGSRVPAKRVAGVRAIPSEAEAEPGYSHPSFACERGDGVREEWGRGSLPRRIKGQYLLREVVLRR